jgi:hypothetical protein
MIHPTAEQKRYWGWLAEHGCVITRGPATLHHVHGGSVSELLGIKGLALKTDHWAVIPLAAEFHSIGAYAIDGEYGVERWEQQFGTQLYWLAHIADKAKSRLGIDLFHELGVTRPNIIPKYPEH